MRSLLALVLAWRVAIATVEVSQSCGALHLFPGDTTSDDHVSQTAPCLYFNDGDRPLVPTISLSTPT